MDQQKLFFFLLLFVFSCQQEEAVPPRDSGPDNPAVTYSQYGIPFRNMPANDDIVMYEVNQRAFSAAGDLAGVVDRLDDIKQLGVNIIWLMPIHPIGRIKSVNSPYSIRDYKAISTEYGTLADLRRLTDEAHQRDMAVILDWVANHTAWDNAWIQHKDWYTQDASGNIIHPPGTNWEDVADLNFDNTTMREAMIDAMKYWVLEANVDGYRCDYADGVPFDFWEQALDSLESIPDRDFVYLAEGNRADHFDAGFDLSFGWSFYSQLKNVFAGQPAATLFSTHEMEYEDIAAGGHKLRFSTNHDESAWDATPMKLFGGKEGALAASVLTVFMGGVPLIYGSQEVGRMNNLPFFSNSQINWKNNPDMLQMYHDMLHIYTEKAIARKGSNVDFFDQDVVCFKKTLQGEDLWVIVNTRNKASDFRLPNELENTTWINALTKETLTLGISLPLQSYQYLILTE